jgi:hypothetical protein
MGMFTRGAARASRRASLAAVAAIALAAPASAATLSLVGGTLLPDGSSAITAADKRANPTYGLTLDRQAHVTFTFLSGTPGAPYRPNQLVQNTTGWDLVFRSDRAAAGATSAPILMEAGLLPFKMKIRATREIFTNQNHHTTAGNVAVAFSEFFNNGKSVIARFDDGLGLDRTFDDLVARIDIASVPLPAAGWLLLGGLGLGLTATRRRSPATA